MNQPIDKQIKQMSKLVETKVQNIVDILHKKKLFVFPPTNPNLVKKIVYRHTSDSILLIKKMEIRNKNKQKYLKAVKKFRIDKYDLDTDYVNSLTSYILGEFELLKRFLREQLKKIPLQINDTTTYGQLIVIIARETRINRKKLNKFFELELRNALAHDSWFIENGKVCFYNLKNRMKVYDLNQLWLMSLKIHHLETSFLLNYYSKFRKKRVIHLNQIFK